MEDNKEENKNLFDRIKFPIVRKVEATTIADKIEGFQPDLTPPKYVDTYIDHWGNTVNVRESGLSVTTSYNNDTDQYGDWGHAFLNGWYVIDENKNHVYAGEERYSEIAEKCRPFWQVLDGLQKKFPEYRVERGRGDRIFVNDKMIKGILLYPGMRMASGSVEEEIKSISEFIQTDIDNKRIIKGKYGIEK